MSFHYFWEFDITTILAFTETAKYKKCSAVCYSPTFPPVTIVNPHNMLNVDL